MPHSRKQARSDHSIRSSTSSDLRPTAPEFVPHQWEPGKNIHCAGPVPANLVALHANSWLPVVSEPINPTDNTLLFDPFSTDMYGMPFFYHMYPVPIMQPYSKSPRRGKPGPRGRKRGNSSPQKTTHPQLVASSPEHGKKEDAPFSAQLEEIARHAALRHEKKEPSPPESANHTTPTRNRVARNAGNGLYGTIGRGRGRRAGVPIDASTPFPTPVPPSGRQGHVAYTTFNDEQPFCDVINIERAMEWGGGMCNNCDAAH
jgi:hypothetical protein